MPETITLDIEAARDLWKRLVPPAYVKLIEAEDELILREKEKKCQTKQQRENENRSFCALLFLLYFFDRDTGRYLTGDRKPLTQRGIKQAGNTFAAKVQNQLSAIASRLVDGQIGLPEFQTLMAQKVTASHTAAYAIGRGGLSQLTGDVLTDAENVVGYHLDKLNAFVADVRRGGISDEAVIARSKLYGASTGPTLESGFSDTFKRIVESGVKVEERNVLGEAEHCHAIGEIPGCYEETQKGWVDYGTLSRPGLRRCLVNCKCRMEYRTVQI